MAGALAQVNARLTKIADGATRRQYGKTQTPGNAKWSGDLEACIVQKLAAVVQEASGTDLGDRVAQAIETHLLVPNTIEIATGDVLTYIHRGDTLTRTAREVQRHDVLGAIRVYFEEA